MNYTVKSIQSKQTHEWLLKKHYAKRIPSISYSFGLFDKKMLVGIMTIGKPPSNALCIGVCGAKNSEYVYELNRLCTNEGLKKNALSFFVGRVLRLLPPMILVSYADTSQNHHGYIYQATNWIYTGLSAKRTERYDPGNLKKHSRWTTTDMAIRERPQKHRYVYFIGNKSEKRFFKKCLKYEEKPYPKGENKKYDASYKPTTQIEIF